MEKYKDFTKHAEIETKRPIAHPAGAGLLPVGLKLNAVVDKRSGVAMCRVGQSLTLLEREDYEDLTDSPFRVV